MIENTLSYCNGETLPLKVTRECRRGELSLKEMTVKPLLWEIFTQIIQETPNNQGYSAGNPLAIRR